MNERFGETGHDYKRQDDGSIEVDEAKVNEMLSARLHARLNRDFVAADRIRDDLRRQYNVEVQDQERSWQVVAPEGGGGGGGEAMGGGGGGGGGMVSDDDDRFDRRRGREEEEGGEEAAL